MGKCGVINRNNLTYNNKLIPNLNQGIMGVELPRKEWSVLNRLLTGHGCCADMMHKWRLRDSSTCDCGNHTQTVKHIIAECRLRKCN